jgi:hypothetical protein
MPNFELYCNALHKHSNTSMTASIAVHGIVLHTMITELHAPATPVSALQHQPAALRWLHLLTCSNTQFHARAEYAPKLCSTGAHSSCAASCSGLPAAAALRASISSSKNAGSSRYSGLTALTSAP